VLTHPGDTFAARVAGSLNHHLGMAGMNVDTDEAFVARGIQLARDPAALRALRAELARRRSDSGLFDMTGFARDFTDAVQRMARSPVA
jgi:predicted O-linked N-acetylglucosamine transferase (SPINDLY family)